MEDIIRKILKEYTEEINETSKRKILHPRTISDLEYMTDIIYNAWKKQDDETPKKGEIYVEDSTGDYSTVPVYYLSDFKSQAAVFQLNPKKERNLYNLFIVVNPEHSLVQSRKSVYNLLYHEVQHLVDLNTTSKLSTKKIGDYNPNNPKKYYGHPFEFRAYVNGILEALVREYKELIGRYPKQDLLDSIDTALDFFGKSGDGDDILKKVLFNISSEEEKDGYPYIVNLLSLIREYNPGQWNDFLKMLYSTVNEIKNYIEEQYREEMVEDYNGSRKMSKSYCKKTPCKKMGFSQKASCRPYKNCY